MSLKSASETALVVVGHGSALTPGSSAPTRAHADLLRKRGLFAEVHAAFWKEAPHLSEILDRVTADKVVVVPNLACPGYITGTVIPHEMGLTGPVTERKNKRIRLTDPVGTHPGIAEAVASRVRAVIEESVLPADQVCLLLIGHGSTRNPQSSLRTHAVADELRAMGLAAEVRAAFLEQEPKLEDWRDVITAPNLIALPFMISNGLHGARDVPALLGFDADAPELVNMAETGTPAGPFEVSGRRLWYCRAVGSEPLVADIIADLALAAAGG